MAFDVITTTLSSTVANGGTFTVGYPANRDPGAYTQGYDHFLTSNPYGRLSRLNGLASFTFGAASVTITNNSGVALLAGTEIRVQLDRVGDDDGVIALANPGKMSTGNVVTINLGAPDVADADGVAASQSLTAAATNALINGALASGNVATFDVPRNVVAAWTNAAVITVTGTDEYGNVVRESSASGTSLAGKKAFKTVDTVTVSANVTGLTVGSGDVFGLPVFLPGVGAVIRELQDGAVATAGTVVAGDLAVATATTGDVRGTYDPNAAADGARSFQLVAVLGDPSLTGRAQFAG